MPASPVRKKLARLPASPGVYVFREANGGVLYVGKARSLRARVRSYFQPGASDDRYFINLLENEVADIETYVAATEKEAALLENQLIKEYQPRYNVKLRDDKDYLSLRLAPKLDWPRLEVVRRPKADGAHYYGPYHSATAARQTLRLVNRFFQLRTCTDAEMRRRVRPCLQYQIKRCPAPCVHDVDRREYGEQVRLVGLFLDGRHDELVSNLEEKMQRTAELMEYELAAVYRDQIRAVDRARETQRVSSVKAIDQDVVGYFRQADQAEVAVLRVRRGKLIGVRTFDLDSVAVPDDELVASFVSDYYSRGTYVPDEVLVPVRIEAVAGLAEVLSDRRGIPARVVVPKRGPRYQLVRMAQENAAHAYHEKARARESVEQRLAEVQRRLRLDSLPRRIECIDVSHTGGEDPVASIVALENAAPDRKRYRSFNVKKARGGDDYGAMYEVLSRRIRRGRDGDDNWPLPDLLVVDGGKGQLNAALAVLKDLRVDTLPVVALAKERERQTGEKDGDRVFLPGVKDPISLRGKNAPLQLLALARDEAHRTSNLHRKRRGRRRRFTSSLDEVTGVGPKTKTRLLTEFGSLKAIQEADVAALIQAGASRKQAAAIAHAIGVRSDPQPASTPNSDGGDRDAREAESEAIDNAFVFDET